MRDAIQSSPVGPRTQAVADIAVMNRGRCLTLFEFVCRPPGAKGDGLFNKIFHADEWPRQECPYRPAPKPTGTPVKREKAS